MADVEVRVREKQAVVTHAAGPVAEETLVRAPRDAGYDGAPAI